LGSKKASTRKNTFFICHTLIGFTYNVQAKTIYLSGDAYNDDMSKIGRPPKTKRSAFGERLQFLREEANLTQREVAAALGISQPSYVAWERRDVGLTLEQLQKLAGVLGIDVEEFLATGDKPKRNGPVGRARKTFEVISGLPRSRQKQILDVVDVLMRKDVQAVANGG
jgi:transcriptional regulator with XRE-family HTH domain